MAKGASYRPTRDARPNGPDRELPRNAPVSLVMADEPTARLDRTAFSVVTLEQHEEEELTYWHDKTPEERLRALELTRQILYGYEAATGRVHRVLEVVDQT